MVTKKPPAKAPAKVAPVKRRTPKPKAEQAGSTSGDLSYLGAGSAELANWHRAVMVLQRDQPAEDYTGPEQHHYTLRLAKRGGRAGLKDELGDFTTVRPPYSFDGEAEFDLRPPPRLNEHGAEIREELRSKARSDDA